MDPLFQKAGFNEKAELGFIWKAVMEYPDFLCTRGKGKREKE